MAVLQKDKLNPATATAYSGHWGHGCVFLGYIFWKKAFCLFAPPRQVLFLTIFNENTFPKIQANIKGAIVTPNKGLE